MKKIHKINQYLLEKYPTIWNTRIVWMLLIASCIHIFFFFIGYISHSNPTSLQDYAAVNDYFKDGIVFIQLIISVLLIVGWLIMMFKNNAFKNFYPTSRWKLFSQFLQYFVIIFFSVSFYFSYMTGFKLFINNRYDDTSMTKKIETINRAYPFLSQNINDYTLNNKRYPAIFSQLYCEQQYIDYSKKYFSFYDKRYQYYSLYPRTITTKDKNGNFLLPPEGDDPRLLAIKVTRPNSATYYYKKDVVDITPYVKTSAPSYYNFSEVFYFWDKTSASRHNSYEADDSYYDYSDKKYENERVRINKVTSELMDRSNKVEIQKLLSDFLTISRDFGIKNNLEEGTWFNLIYNPDAFEVKKFIIEKSEYSAVVVEDNITSTESYSTNNFYKNHMTGSYYNSEDLHNLLENVDQIKRTDIFVEHIHIFLWLAFALSTLIFSFRIAGLRPLLFSAIVSGILILLHVLIFLLYSNMIDRNTSMEFFASYFTLATSIIILIVPLLGLQKMNKTVSSIFMLITINGFLLLVFLIFIIISIHQKQNCLNTAYNYSECKTVFDTLGFFISYITLGVSFIFIYLYTSLIRKWKALPE